jgi:C4-dicarboxylate-specific signal transduction histidine kinase
MKTQVRSIHGQVLLFTFLIGLGVLLPVGGVLLVTHIGQFKAKLSQSFQATSRIIAFNAAAPLAFEDRIAAHELLSSLVNDPSITAAALYNKAGALFVSYGTTPAALSAVEAVDGFSSVLVGVDYKGEVYGQLLLISRYPSELRRTVTVWVFIYIAGFALAAVLAMMIAARFQKAVATPLRSLAAIADEVTSVKNYTARVMPNGPNEVMGLARAFNTMLEEIGRRDTALARQLEALRKEVGEREAAEQRLVENNREMMRLSREAGMNEVATGVLHNIGNALNSINVSTEIAYNQINAQARTTAVTMRDFFQHPPENAAPVFSAHPLADNVRAFAASLAALSVEQLEESSQELAALRTSVAHLKDIVSRQQTLAKSVPLTEPFDLRDAVRDALVLTKSDVQSINVCVESTEPDRVDVLADRSSVVQILINLITNAGVAMTEVPSDRKKLLIRIGPPSGEHVPVAVIDSGCGIASHQLVSIFSYGFTTRREGHGFGLHNSANIARLNGGRLEVASSGPGTGATFTLHLLRHPLSSS